MVVYRGYQKIFSNFMQGNCFFLNLSKMCLCAVRPRKFRTSHKTVFIYSHVMQIRTIKRLGLRRVTLFFQHKALIYFVSSSVHIAVCLLKTGCCRKTLNSRLVFFRNVSVSGSEVAIQNDGLTQRRRYSSARIAMIKVLTHSGI